MASILTMNFASSDDDDDHNYSDHLNSKITKQKGNKSNTESKNKKFFVKKKCNFDSIKTRNLIQDQINREKSLKIFDEMKQNHEMSIKNQSNIIEDDFMLQFHKKIPKDEIKKNSTKNELFHSLDVNISRADLGGFGRFNIKDIKTQCRSMTEIKNLSEITESALKEIELSSLVSVNKTMLFAGRTIMVEEEMDVSSRKYHSFVKNKDRKVGGQLEIVDNIVSEIDGSKVISSIDKSQADWKQFKKDSGFEMELQTNRKNGFLDKKFFLLSADYNDYSNQLEKRRKLVDSGTPAEKRNTS